MPSYEVTITVSVPDVESDTEMEAIAWVIEQVKSTFDEPQHIRFYSPSAVDHDAE